MISFQLSCFFVNVCRLFAVQNCNNLSIGIIIYSFKLTMGTMPSPSQLEDVGVSSDGPPSINKNLQETSRSSPLKRPKETSKKRQPTAKRAKLSAAGIQQESPRSYKLKRPIETSKKKQPATKQFKPPMAEKMLSVDRSPLLRRSPLVRNPELRLVVSPVVIAQSPRSSPPSPPLPVERSSSPSSLSVSLLHKGNYGG